MKCKCNPVNCLSIINSLTSSIFGRVDKNGNDSSVSTDTLPSCWTPDIERSDKPVNAQTDGVESVRSVEGSKSDTVDDKEEETLEIGSDASEYFSAETNDDNKVVFIKNRKRQSESDDDHSDNYVSTILM